MPLSPWCWAHDPVGACEPCSHRTLTAASSTDAQLPQLGTTTTLPENNTQRRFATLAGSSRR
jgi:hypothetical protein